MVRRFKVSAQWMKACGKGDQPKTFDIENIEDFSLVTPSTFFAQMVHVVDEKGNKWLVAVGRGEFVEEPDAPATQADTLTIETASDYAKGMMQKWGYQQVSVVAAEVGSIDNTPIVKVQCTYKPETDIDDFYQAKAHWEVWLNEDNKLYGEC